MLMKNGVIVIVTIDSGANIADIFTQYQKFYLLSSRKW